jgi:hypothetical protein
LVTKVLPSTCNGCYNSNMFAPDHAQGHTTLGKDPLDEASARCRDHYLTTDNTHKRQISMLPPEFEPAIPTSEQPQTHSLDRPATGIGILHLTGSISWRRLRWSCLYSILHVISRARGRDEVWEVSVSRGPSLNLTNSTKSNLKL